MSYPDFTDFHSKKRNYCWNTQLKIKPFINEVCFIKHHCTQSVAQTSKSQPKVFGISGLRGDKNEGDTVCSKKNVNMCNRQKTHLFSFYAIILQNYQNNFKRALLLQRRILYYIIVQKKKPIGV